MRWPGLDETGSTRALAVTRVGFGLLLGEQAWRLARDLAGGWMAPDRFRWPLLPEALVAPRAAWIALAALLALLALAVTVGVKARAALAASAAIHLYALAADRLGYHHHRYALALFALLLALAPCDRLLVASGARDPIGPLWAQRLAGLQVSILYLASGGSKLLDPDWRAGRVICDGVARFAATAIARGAPARLVLALSEPPWGRAIASLTIVSELFLAVGLWWRRTRALALFWGVWFHLAIEATTSVAIFSWMMLLLYALFASPAERERVLLYDPGHAPSRIAARAVAALDWLARFAIVAAPGARFTTVERGGRVAPPAATLARALPLLFPAWLPLAALGRLLPRRRVALEEQEVLRIEEARARRR